MKNNKKMKLTFKQKLFRSNIIMVFIIIVCIVLFNYINTITVVEYSETTTALNELNAFYEHVNEMGMYVKDYLYTENDESLLDYNEHSKQASYNIVTLKKSATAENYYRFVMLERMLESYEEISEKLIKQFDEKEKDYTQLYNDFLESKQLIGKTSDDYYNVITKEVSVQLNKLKTFKNSTELASLLVLFTLCAWVLYYSYQLTKSITKPIDLLLKNISRIKEGKYDLSEVSTASKEMEDLCADINDMAVAVQKNIETTQERAKLEKQLLEWKNENLKKDELLAQSEIKMLQNQINPHFLFNTLNMIYKLAIQEGAENAADILIKTSHLLRYGLDKQSKLSDLKSEVEVLKYYISIQEIRLGNRVHFDLQFEDEEHIGGVPIPGMILQPLVENAIKHGLKDCLEDGEIEIHIYEDHDAIMICVGDNGVGMPSDELDRFIVNDYQKTGGNHLGLYNVIRRLQMYYANKITIIINSDVECGFEIVFRIQR